MGSEPRTKSGCRAEGISNGGKLFTSGLILALSAPGVDFGVGLDRLGLLLRDVSSCLRFGEMFVGELLECDVGVTGGDPCRDGTHSIFSGEGERLKFSFSSPRSITRSLSSGDFLILKSNGAEEVSRTTGASLGLLADLSTSG